MPLNVSSRSRHRLRRPAVLGLGLALGALFGPAACGSRSSLFIAPPPPEPPECLVDDDCEGHDDLCNPVTCEPGPPEGEAGGEPRKGGHCVPHPVSCNDENPCTTDACDAETGKCVHASAVLDLDGDGFFAPLPGKKPGAPGSCGDDCDDTNPSAHPGGVEVCDGVDNDCNGVVDDNADFVPLGEEPVRIDGEIAPAWPGGVAWSGKSYATTYTGTSVSGFQMFSNFLSPTGQILDPGEKPFVVANGDSSSGPIIWIGDRFGTVWSDRRDGDYEIYFAEMDENGMKIAPGDVRLTFAPTFSINPTMIWNGSEFLVVWQDARDGLFNLYAQRVTVDGAPNGENVPLTQGDTFGSESPVAAGGRKTLGITWSAGGATSHTIQFQSFELDLSGPVSVMTPLTDGSTEAVYPTIVWNKDRYVVAWYDRTASPAGIWATAVDEAGNVLVAPRPVSDPGAFHSRYPFLRPLGDRILVLYSDDRDQNGGYELYSRTIGPDLKPLGAEVRLTNAARDSIYPTAAFGPDGDLGILFRDDRIAGEHHVFFTRLGCVTSTTPP